MILNYRIMGFRIAQRRQALGLRQAQLSKAAGVTQKYISDIETGKKHPSLETLVNICEALRITPDYVILGAMVKEEDKNIVDSLKLLSPQEKRKAEKIIRVLCEKSDDWF